MFQEPYISYIMTAIVIIVLLILWYKGQRKIVLKTIKYLVDYAEEKFGCGAGEIKYNYVVSNLYPELPLIIKLFVSPERLDNWIEKAVDELQERLYKEINE